MGGFTFVSADNLVPRYSEITDGPQQRLYTRNVWDAIPLPLFGSEAGAGLWNDGGLLALIVVDLYPTSPAGLPAGSLWDNGLTISVVGPTTPNPAAPPVRFPPITAIQLFALGGANLPTTQPSAGSSILWNNGGLVCVA